MPMGDNVYDDGGKDGELSCEITRLSSTETTESLPNVCGVCKRSKSMKIGLFVSFLVNLVFTVLFVVVFIMLNDLNTRLSHYDDRMNARFNEGKIDGQVGSTVASKSSSRPPETSSTPTQVPSRSEGNTPSSSTGGKIAPGSCKCVGIPGPRGLKGDKGDKGERGQKGRAGRKGQKGDDGNLGLPGQKGQPGKQGPLGLQGLPGPVGPKGEPGPAFNTSYVNAVKERPSVHLTGHSISHTLGEDLEKTIDALRIWSTRTLGHSTSGMFSQDATSDIHIMDTGKYFIYSQVYFQVPKGIKLDDRFQTYLIHYVLRKSNSTTILMRGVVSNGLVKKDSAYYTSFTCGVHLLDKGDTIYVGIQKKQSVIINSGDTSSFFGAFKI